jgi:multiple antibiotic resistance protein
MVDLRGLILFHNQSIEVRMPLLHVSISDVLIIFFLTLGPLKAIAPFAQLTQGTDPAFRRAVAWRATTIATIIVLAVALLGALVLENWHVSVAAIVITGGIILFCQAFQLLMQPLAAAPSPIPQDAGQSPPSLEIAHFPLAIPVLVTAPGIAAIAGFMAIAAGHWTQKGIVLAALLVIMGLNLVTLLNIEAILKHGSPLVQRVLGWVMAVLQAALAVQYIINGLVRLGALPTLVS